jgi:hypothetical protein
MGNRQALKAPSAERKPGRPIVYDPECEVASYLAGYLSEFAAALGLEWKDEDTAMVFRIVEWIGDGVMLRD